MSHQPVVIPDPYEFARRGESLSGELDARKLPRLAGELRGAGSAQVVAYTLSGFRQDDKSFLHIEAQAELVMQCQRCLGEATSVVDVDACLLLVPRGEELPDEALEDDDFDPVHAGRDFDVLEALEEELLLALPLAPTHDNCSVPVAKGNGDDGSPFAVLRGLKLSGGAKRND